MRRERTWIVAWIMFGVAAIHAVEACAAEPLSPSAKEVKSAVAPAGNFGPFSAAEAKIYAQLGAPCKIEFVETPLKDILEYIQERHGVSLMVDTLALNDVAIDPSTPMTINLKDIPLQAVLNRLIGPLNLTWTIHDQVILVTTPDKAKKLTSTRIYQLRKFLGPERAQLPRPTELAKIIMAHVSPESWQPKGACAIDAMEGESPVLIVTQTWHGHASILQLLTELGQSPSKEAVK